MVSIGPSDSLTVTRWAGGGGAAGPARCETCLGPSVTARSGLSAVSSINAWSTMIEGTASGP